MRPPIPATGQPPDPQPLTVLLLVAAVTAAAAVLIRRPDLILPKPPTRLQRLLHRLHLRRLPVLIPRRR